MSDNKDFVIENGVLKKYVGIDAEVVIPDGVTKIEDHAFYGCENLTAVTIPDGVTEIWYSAFDGCKSLTSVTIPDSVTKIGGSAFWECASLTSVTIPDGVTEIESSAFYGCKNLTSVTISDSVTKIGEWAFHGCENLTSVTIPDSVTEIGDDAFSRCGKLNVRLSGSPTLGKDAFDGVFGIIAPQTSVSEFSDTEAKKVATRAFLSNIPLYTDFVIAEDYKKYAISKRKKLLPDILKEDNA